MHAKAPPTGVYVPSLSFWKDKWNLSADLDTFRRHLDRLSDEGIRGITLFGYYGEGAYLTKSERKEFLQVAKEVLKPKNVSILVECSEESLWETQETLKAAHEGGADYAFLTVPMIYLEEIDLEDLFAYFHQLSEWVDLPYVIRAPASDSRLAFGPEFIRRLSAIPNCVGCLLPAFDPIIPKVAEEHCKGDDFAIFCTYPGDLGPSKLRIRLQGAIGNISPFAMARFYDNENDRFSETMELILTTKVLREIATKVTGLKYAMTRVRGYGGTCRPPLPVPHPELRARIDPILPSLAGDFFQRRWMQLEGMDINEDENSGSEIASGVNTPRE